MADRSRNPPPVVPDYDLCGELELAPEQLKLLLDATRRRIIDLLSERAATTSQLADIIGRPKGTIGHHCKALEGAGLIHVVRTAKVRAIEARYYGRTARLFIMGNLDDAGVSLGVLLDDSYAELRQAVRPPADPDDAHMVSVRYARIPQEQAKEWADRLGELMDEFAAQRRSGDTTYGFFVGFYRTDRKGFE